MFKNISINLTGPICKCESQDLGWGIELDKDSRVCLVVFCKICHTKIHIPNQQFVAYFSLEKGYPKGTLPPRENMDIAKEAEENDKKFLKDLHITPDLKSKTDT